MRSRPASLAYRSRKNLEFFGRIPDARLRGIQIREDAQDAPAARGAARKCVHMQQIVAFVQRQPAAFFFERAKARKIDGPFPGVGHAEIWSGSRSVARCSSAGWRARARPSRHLPKRRAKRLRSGGRKRSCACAARPIAAPPENRGPRAEDQTGRSRKKRIWPRSSSSHQVRDRASRCSGTRPPAGQLVVLHRDPGQFCQLRSSRSCFQLFAAPGAVYPRGINAVASPSARERSTPSSFVSRRIAVLQDRRPRNPLP